MRAPLLVLAASLSVAVLVSPVLTAAAVGPGGWDHVGSGVPSTTTSLNGPVYALNTQLPGSLLVGDSFTTAAGKPNAARIARWDGSIWRPLGSTPLTNGSVNAIAYQGGKTYVGGTFTNAGGNADADFLAVWDGSTWAPACSSTMAGPAIGAARPPDHRQHVVRRRRLRQRRRTLLGRPGRGLRPDHRRTEHDRARRQRVHRHRLRVGRRLQRRPVRRWQLRQPGQRIPTPTTSRRTTARGTRWPPRRSTTTCAA